MTAFHETAPTGATAGIASRIRAAIPVLQTERLVLRAPRVGDFSVFAEMLKGPRGRFYGQPKTRAETWAIFMQLTGTWLLRGHGAWTVTDRGTGNIFGFVQIGAEPGDQEPELGYLVSAEAEGRGIAFEAAAAVRDYAFETAGLPSLVSYVSTENTRSARLAERLGGQHDAAAARALPGGGKCYVFRHTVTGGT